MVIFHFLCHCKQEAENPLVVSEPLAQSVEQQPFKLWVAGSNPARLTILHLSGTSVSASFVWQASFLVDLHYRIAVI